MLSGLYLRLPGPVQSLAASLRGWQLQQRRYGPETERLVEEALARDSWDASRWSAWRAERLPRVLHDAATRVEYYRRSWEERRRRGDKASWEDLANWPILAKQTLRDSPEAFLAEPWKGGRLYETSTSGTTGTPLRLWQSRETLVAWYALFEARIRRWNGVSRGSRWAHLGGQRITPPRRRRPPYWVWNAAMRQLYLSTYHIRPGTVADYLDALRRHRVEYLFGYASALGTLATTARAEGADAPPLRFVVSNAEPFYRFQREAVAEVFRCPVRDTYGQAEIVSGGSECASGSLHEWPDVGVTEWLADGENRAVGPGESGRLVCTALLNPAMPLVRYEVGDRGFAPLPGHRCECGRALPVIGGIDGRTVDYLTTPEGARTTSLDTVFTADLPMREGQIIQETLTSFRILVVPAPGFSEAHRRSLVSGIREQLGHPVDVSVEIVDAIERTPAGKFRIQISRLGEVGARGETPAR